MVFFVSLPSRLPPRLPPLLRLLPLLHLLIIIIPLRLLLLQQGRVALSSYVCRVVLLAGVRFICGGGSFLMRCDAGQLLDADVTSIFFVLCDGVCVFLGCRWWWLPPCLWW